MRGKKEIEPQVPDTFLYTLAHHLVMGLFFESPERFYKLATREWGLGFRDFIWDQALPAAAAGANWEPKRREFTCRPVTVKGWPAVLLTFPKPTEQALCHMALAVLEKSRPASAGQDGQERASGHYITLERGSSRTQTVLCEWISSGAHLNYGDGPAPNEEAFLRAACVCFPE